MKKIEGIMHRLAVLALANHFDVEEERIGLNMYLIDDDESITLEVMIDGKPIETAQHIELVQVIRECGRQHRGETIDKSNLN
jgi:hypothetical protein